MNLRFSLGLASLCLAGALPFLVGNEYYVNVSSQILIYALFALSLNVMVGYGGMISLGHAANLGIAAYTVAWATSIAGWSPLEAVALALLTGTALAAVFGALALRVSGLSFMMITLAFGQIVWGIAYRWVSVTNGDNGLKIAQRPTILGIEISNPTNFYYFIFTVFLVSLYALWRLSRSPFGAALRGTRDQPRRMRMLGHNTLMIRWMAFVISGFWGSVAGVLFVYYNQFISPHSIALQQSAEGLLMVILGGVGTLAGPIIGAAIISAVKILLSSYTDRWFSILGLIFIFTVVYMPNGIVPGVEALWRRLGPDKKPATEVVQP